MLKQQRISYGNTPSFRQSKSPWSQQDLLCQRRAIMMKRSILCQCRPLVQRLLYQGKDQVVYRKRVLLRSLWVREMVQALSQRPCMLQVLLVLIVLVFIVTSMLLCNVSVQPLLSATTYWTHMSIMPIFFLRGRPKRIPNLHNYWLEISRRWSDIYGLAIMSS